MKISNTDRLWQKNLYNKAKNLAGKRYTPEINVDLPIIQTFDGLARNKDFYDNVRKFFGELREGGKGIYPHANEDLLGVELLNFDYGFEELLSLFASIKEYSTTKIHWEEIEESRQKLEDYSWKLQDKIRQVQNSPDNEKREPNSERIFSSESGYLSRFMGTLHKLDGLAGSDAVKLSNHPALLLTGSTGIGKTHLLCDLVGKRIESGAFSFITLGQEVNETEDIWKQIVSLNSDNKIKSKSELLRKFDKLGNKTKSRFFIIIDALNESQNPQFWKKSLPVLLKDIKKYPNIALIVSVRSGFEKEVIATNVRKRFYEVEHVGFRFKEWEAIKAFFTQFGLPLPEIPLINPEFSVPLFLLLFCKSRQRRAKQKKNRQLFRGHEGSTSIFEDFIKGVSENIGKEFSIGTVDKVWNMLIKPLAEEMVSNRIHKDRISESRFRKLVSRNFPLVDFDQLSLSLERNHLLLKIPRYGKGGKKTGSDYRFTYQRFSDHLIARYLMNKYADKKIYGLNAKNNLKNKLRKKGIIGKNFLDYSFKGVMDALSIQVPERLGEELIDLCPWAEQMLEESFLDSLIWRDPKAFYLNSKGRPEKTISIINRLILPFDGGHSKFFSSILNVSGVPNHPFNALRVHDYLLGLGMAHRDSLWSTFLSYEYGENGSVDRLLHWVLSASFNKVISNQSKLLMGIILAWFLTTSNRKVRDRATKGLVVLLEDSPSTLLELNKLFVNVDDPYVIERLYAVTYGVLLRLDSYKDSSLGELGKLIYRNIFLARKPVAHILIRDYAKCALDLLVKKKVYYPSKPTKISSVLNTSWPERLPTMKTLEEKFEPKSFTWDKASYEERGVRAIWNSFDGIGDFYRYMIEPAIDHWSDKKKSESLPLTLKELKEDFLKTLSKPQKKIYKQLEDFRPFISLFSYLDMDTKAKSEEEIKKLKEEKKLTRAFEALKKSFWGSLSNDQKVIYRKILRQTVYRYPRKTGKFNPELAKRWILKRVFELYNPKLHGYFDGMRASHYDVTREDHPTERIGKKYQWIALHELLGHLADNFRFFEKDYPPVCGDYKGAWQIRMRDIDPSCTTMYKPGFRNSPWQVEYNAWKVKEGDTTWLKRKSDLPEPMKLLLYKDPEGREWYILNTYFEWEQEIPPEEERYRYPRRDIFYILNSYLIKTSEATKLFKWLKNQNFYGRWMPEVGNGVQEAFFREFPDSDIYKEIYSEYETSLDGWITHVRPRKRMPGNIMEVYDEFPITNASRDQSVEDSFSIGLPSMWFIKLMNLRHSSKDGFWVDRSNREICGDLSLKEGGRSMLAIEKKPFLKFLKKNGLALTWTLIGEKGVFGNERGKIKKISGAYILNSDGTIKGAFRLISEKED